MHVLLTLTASLHPLSRPPQYPHKTHPQTNPSHRRAHTPKTLAWLLPMLKRSGYDVVTLSEAAAAVAAAPAPAGAAPAANDSLLDSGSKAAVAGGDLVSGAESALKTKVSAAQGEAAKQRKGAEDEAKKTPDKLKGFLKGLGQRSRSKAGFFSSGGGAA
jgi:hypothetical protein